MTAPLIWLGILAACMLMHSAGPCIGSGVVSIRLPRPLLRLRGAGDARAPPDSGAAALEKKFRPRVLEDELGTDSLDARGRDSALIESALRREQSRAPAADGESFWTPRDKPLQSPTLQRWEDMELPDLLMNYIGARVKEIEARPEIVDWWAGPEKHSPAWNVSSELWEAARRGDAAAVVKALDAGADVNARNPECVGNTALHYAANHGWNATAELLLRRGADVHAKTNWGSSALHYAAKSGHLRICEVLLAAGADAFDKDMIGHNALDRATVACHKQVRDLLAAEMSAASGESAKSQIVEGLPWDTSEDEASAAPLPHVSEAKRVRVS
jgi:hypothetical protein